jgi:hypothetical protein
MYAAPAAPEDIGQATASGTQHGPAGGKVDPSTAAQDKPEQQEPIRQQREDKTAKNAAPTSQNNKARKNKAKRLKKKGGPVEEEGTAQQGRSDLQAPTLADAGPAATPRQDAAQGLTIMEQERINHQHIVTQQKSALQQLVGIAAEEPAPATQGAADLGPSISSQPDIIALHAEEAGQVVDIRVPDSSTHGLPSTTLQQNQQTESRDGTTEVNAREGTTHETATSTLRRHSRDVGDRIPLDGFYDEFGNRLQREPRGRDNDSSSSGSSDQLLRLVTPRDRSRVRCLHRP